MSWPLVDPLDDGIRPAGKSDECFYCGQRVGRPHDRECVIVTKRVEMRVEARLPSGEVLRGTWQFDDPYFWDAGMVEFHKNESSWCASNFMNVAERNGDVAWDPGSEGAFEKLGELDTEENCLCGVLSFTFERVVDDAPRRKLRQVKS
jgi:hypothetical protein